MHPPLPRPLGPRVTRLAVLALLLTASATPVARAQDLVGLYLTWSDDPATTMTVNWVNLYPEGTTTVYYRKAGEKEWQSGGATRTVLEPSSLQRRHVQLEDLEPDTTYQFGIGDKPKDDGGWTFRTMPAELTRPIRFVTGGDMMHSRAMLDAMNSRVGPIEPDFALFGGDLAYEDGRNASRWVHWLESWKEWGVGENRRLIPMVLAIGNHEVRGGYDGEIPDDAPYFYGLFTLPDDRAYYALDFGNYLSLVVLDSDHTNPIEGPQADWLAEALAKRSGQTFLFACYHYPAYGTEKAPAGGLPIDAPRSIEIRQHWVPHFERYGVTAVFENDHHNYKRTHRLRNHRRDDANGILYLGDGAWGVRTREVPDPEVAWWLARAAPRNHLWIVDLLPDKTATFRAMDPNGRVFDRVKLDTPRTTPVP